MPRWSKVAVWAFVVATVAALWLIAADYIFLTCMARLDLADWPFDWWARSLRSWGYDVRTNLSLAAGGMLPTFLFGFLARQAYRYRDLAKRVKAKKNSDGERETVLRGSSDNHGHADWMSMEEARERFPGPTRAYGGIIVGEAYRPDNDTTTSGRRFDSRDESTWGQGGKADLLIDPCTDDATNCLVFSGPGGYKTSSALGTLFTWHGSSVVHDPSREVGPMVAKSLRAIGKTVHFLDPLAPPDAETWGFNVLDWIDPNEPMAEAHIGTVVSWIYGDDPANLSQSDQTFRAAGKQLVQCLLAHMIWADVPKDEKSLKTLRAGISISTNTMKTVLLPSIAETSNSQLARQHARSLMEIVDETFSGIHFNANTGTFWLSISELADLVSGDAFQTTDILNGRTTVFVQIRMTHLSEYPGVARVCIGALMNAVIEAQLTRSPNRVLFMIDEAAMLGRMKVIETARDFGRKSGITLYVMFQSVGQMEEQWGAAQVIAWHDGVSWVRYSSLQDITVAKKLADSIGTLGVLAHSEGDNTGRQARIMSLSTISRGRNVNVHEISRHLLSAPELLHDLRPDEAIVMVRNRLPLRVGLPIYFRRPEFLALVEA